MKSNRRIYVNLILALVVTLFIASCGTSEVTIEPSETPIGLDDKGPLPTEEPTPPPLETDLVWVLPVVGGGLILLWLLIRRLRKVI